MGGVEGKDSGSTWKKLLCEACVMCVCTLKQPQQLCLRESHGYQLQWLQFLVNLTDCVYENIFRRDSLKRGPTLSVGATLPWLGKPQKNGKLVEMWPQYFPILPGLSDGNCRTLSHTSAVKHPAQTSGVHQLWDLKPRAQVNLSYLNVFLLGILAISKMTNLERQCQGREAMAATEHN